MEVSTGCEKLVDMWAGLGLSLTVAEWTLTLVMSQREGFFKRLVMAASAGYARIGAL